MNIYEYEEALGFGLKESSKEQPLFNALYALNFQVPDYMRNMLEEQNRQIYEQLRVSAQMFNITTV